MSVHSRPISKRSIVFLSPQLGVLNNIPFATPFEARVNISDLSSSTKSTGSGQTYACSRSSIRVHTPPCTAVTLRKMGPIGWEPEAPHWNHVHRPIQRAGVSTALHLFFLSAEFGLIGQARTGRALMVGASLRSS